MDNALQLRCVACSFVALGDANIFTCPHHNPYYSYLEVINGDSDFSPLNGEGDTPLLFLPAYSSNICSVYVKDESQNPTGSVKDREVAGIFRQVMKKGIKEVSIVSAGNGAISAAYYAKKAGVILHSFSGDYEAVFKETIDSNVHYNITPGINPFAEEGTKYIARELAEQIPDISAVIVPVGNGTQLAAIWKGFKELHLEYPPQMIGVEIEGCDPVYQAYKQGVDFVELDSLPFTKATGIAAKCAFTSPKAVRALRESNGTIVRITERELQEAMSRIEREKLFVCGPTSASVFAALEKISIGGNVVCILSGKQ